MYIHNTIQYNTIKYNTIQYNTTQHNIIQHNTLRSNTIQYDIMQCTTIQYNTIQCIITLFVFEFVLSFHRTSTRLDGIQTSAYLPVPAINVGVEPIDEQDDCVDHPSEAGEVQSRASALHTHIDGDLMVEYEPLENGIYAAEGGVVEGRDRLDVAHDQLRNENVTAEDCFQHLLQVKLVAQFQPPLAVRHA